MTNVPLCYRPLAPNDAESIGLSVYGEALPPKPAGDLEEFDHLTDIRVQFLDEFLQKIVKIVAVALEEEEARRKAAQEWRMREVERAEYEILNPYAHASLTDLLLARYLLWRGFFNSKVY